MKEIIVDLNELAQQLDCVSDNIRFYLNKKTGEFIPIGETEISEYEFQYNEEEEAEKNYEGSDFDKDFLAIIRDESDDYLMLPEKYDINSYSIMKNFCYSIENPERRNLLLNSIHGKGAFGRFKNAICRLGIEKDWYKYKDNELKEIGREWCEVNNIKYKE